MPIKKPAKAPKTKTAKTKITKPAKSLARKTTTESKPKPSFLLTLRPVLLYSLLIVAAFFISNIIVAIGAAIFTDDLEIAMQSPLFGAITTAAVFSIMLAVTLIIPRAFFRVKITRADLGLVGLPTWTDILLSPIGYIISSVIGGLLLFGLAQLLPMIDPDQQQALPFTTLVHHRDYILAFVSLVVIAPIAEEILFRGFFYSKLRPHVNMWVAALIVSVIFGALHGQWNVGIVVFTMSFVMCFVREKLTGTVWAPILIHMLRNGIAFYLLFVNTDLLRMIGG